jgi:redox-sensitive bicupin YhaK (pirin superfamily)
MITLRPSHERGHLDHGWLDARHSFSFGQYRDPEHMGFRALRVINEDRVQPGQGFGMHGHEDMEIITFVIEGALNHKDSMGNEASIPAGAFQRMSAGRGVRHSEFNGSDTDRVYLLQIWILPDENGIEPEFDEREPNPEAARNRLRPVIAPDGREGAMVIHQDAALYHAILDEDASVTHPLTADRHGWVQVVSGAVTVNGHALGAGDAAALSGEDAVEILAGAGGGEVLLFDLN